MKRPWTRLCSQAREQISGVIDGHAEALAGQHRSRQQLCMDSTTGSEVGKVGQDGTWRW